MQLVNCLTTLARSRDFVKHVPKRIERRTIMNSKMKKRIRTGVWCFISAFLFLLIFSFSTSPLYFYSTFDSSIYILIGKFMKDGLIMYRDFFEHKGPIIFFIECLGSNISEGRIGAFYIQIIFMALTIWGTYKLARVFCGQKKSVVVVIVSIMVLNAFYEGGNLTEEFCIPVIIICLYFMVKFLKVDRIEEYNYKYAAIYGMAFAYCAFIRLTNALPICIFVLAVIIYLLKNKAWIEILKSGLAFLGGMLLITMPIVVYCIYKGILSEMFYCTFAYNIMYAAKAGATKTMLKITNYTYFIPLLVIATTGVIEMIKKKYSEIPFALLLSGLVGIIFQIESRFYLHYFMIWVPVFTIAVSVILSQQKNKKKIYKIAYCVLTVGVLWASAKNILLVKDSYNILHDNSLNLSEIDKESKEIVSGINHKDRILAYHDEPYFYMASDVLPCYKYYTNQDFAGESDSKVEQEFVEYLKSGKVKYIVVGKKRLKGLKHKEIVESRYKLIKKTDTLQLYKLIE
jgi:hypothetical protein